MKTNFHLKLVALICFVLLPVGCTKKIPEKVQSATAPLPEEVVRKFVFLSGQAQELLDKEKLSEMCSGAMKQALAEMNPEQFRLYYLNDNLSVQDFKILSTSKTGVQAKVVYQITIENRQGTDITKEVNQREVDLMETPQGWLIESIRPSGTDKLIFTKGLVF